MEFSNTLYLILLKKRVKSEMEEEMMHEQTPYHLVFVIYQGFFSSAEGCPYKAQGLIAGTLRI